jgi:putative oxidoreductase
MKALLKKIEATDGTQTVPLILRITFSMIMFAHGAQLFLGWFGGYGYTASMGFFSSLGIPTFVGFLVITLEFFGSLFILLGLFTRLFSFAFACLSLGMIMTVHVHVGFFMNWFGNLKGEGFEYHLLMISILLSLIVTGGGKASLDARFFNKNN